MPESEAPGLQRRARAKGEDAAYWVARRVSRKATGYPIKTVRLFGTDAEIAAHCRRLTSQLLEWLAERGEGSETAFEGTIGSLIACYQRDEESPYHAVKRATAKHYDDCLAIVGLVVADVPLDILTRKDFARWYRNFRAPASPGGPERIRRAHNCMKVLRIIVRYGASMRYAGCRDAADILSDMEFALPARRDKALTYDQAKAIVEHALAIGRPSIALGQALQFELSLRQKDVIGEWLAGGAEPSGIHHHGRRWTGGVLWSDLSPDGVLSKQTTKTSTVGEWRVSLSPLIVAALEAFPAAARVGPMIVSENTGRPYVAERYSSTWRKIARAVGVPDDVWNMDSRAGGITEADEAGADPRDMQRYATHASFTTTSRYVRRTAAATAKVARLRVASREKGK